VAKKSDAHHYLVAIRFGEHEVVGGRIHHNQLTPFGARVAADIRRRLYAEQAVASPHAPYDHYQDEHSDVGYDEDEGEDADDAAGAFSPTPES
jgi:hypothetical protein